MNDIVKKVLAGVGVVIVGLAGFGLGSALIEPTVINDTVYVDKIVEVPVEKIIEVPFETIVEKEVLVDNGNLDLVLDYILDNNGNMKELDIKDLDDDEANLIADRIVFVNDAKSLAVSAVQNDFLDLIDKEDFGGVDKFFDEDDVERVRVQDDADEVIVNDVDFEDSDAEVLVEVNFEQEDEKYKAFCIVEIKDGVVDDIEVDSIELRD